MEGFEALAAFANMGETPEELRNFRLQWPKFFSTDPFTAKPGFQDLSDWLYTFAAEWLQEYLEGRVKPPLYWYRDCLRAVWAHNDPTGANLCVLLGFEKEGYEKQFVNAVDVIRPLAIPGQDLLGRETHGLPRGTPVVNGVTGDITWKFGCYLQQAVYALMQCRWRAKICPECGRYFAADKSAQTFCSTRCAGEMKRKRSMDWWNREGQGRRASNVRKARARRKK